MAKFLYKSVSEYSREILDILRDSRVIDGVAVDIKPLEEYLDNIDTLTFESIREHIKGILTLNDIDKVSKEYLPYLAYTVGYIWNNELDVEYQRFLLKNIVQLYKRKGTRFHIHYNLSYFDPNVQIEENYKKIFILNKSLLNSDHRFASSDYSWGVYTVKSDYDAETVKKIIDETRPAGWKTIFEQVDSWSSSFEPRAEDFLWDKIKKTSWYSEKYVRSLHNYIMWGSLTTSSNSMTFEDPTGYFIRGYGKQIQLPRQYELNQINAVSSRKRIFTDTYREIFVGGFGDKGIYLGPTFMHNSLFNTYELGSETLTKENTEKDQSLFLGNSESKLSSKSSSLGISDRHDGGSLFKNFLNYKAEDRAKVGPMMPNVRSVYELGNKNWLEYDRKYVPYTETFSVYMGLKPILWSGTSAPYYNPGEPYDTYKDYKFDQRDLDYYFFIHRAFSPQKYSRPVDLGCKLLDSLMPDDDRIVLSNYDDLPYKGTLIFNNEFIEYEKIVDNSKWVKFYVDGKEIGQSFRKTKSFSYKVSYTHNTDSYVFIIDRSGNASVKTDIYKNSVLQIEGSDYSIVEKSLNSLHIQDRYTGTEIKIFMEGDSPKYWRIIHLNSEKKFSYSLYSNIEYVESIINSDKYEISLNKTEESNYSSTIYTNNQYQLLLNLDLNSKIIHAYSGDNEYSYSPIDGICAVGNYEIQYDEITKDVLIYNTVKDFNLSINFGEYSKKADYSIKAEDLEISDLSATALSDRIDVNFSYNGVHRTVYGASDKSGVFQAFYYEGKNRLQNGKDCNITILPRTIQIKDEILDKTFTIKYHNQPSIPIVRRFVSILGWGDSKNNSSVHPKGTRPRILTQNDVVDYKYKLHKINDMTISVFKFEYPVVTIYLGIDKNYSDRNDPDHNSIYVNNCGKWEYVCKFNEFEQAAEDEFHYEMIFRSTIEFEDGYQELEIGNRCVILSDSTDPNNKKIYEIINVGTEEEHIKGYKYYDTLDNFLLDKELKYKIYKEFSTVYEMEHYLGTDVPDGAYVRIVSPIENIGRLSIIQLHNQYNKVYSSNTVELGTWEFNGKQITPDFIQNTARHIGSHILDKKEVKKTRTSFSLNLGKKQYLSTHTIGNDETPYDITLGGTGNHYQMALNRSYYVYDKFKRSAAGAPIIGVNGIKYELDKTKNLTGYLLGERKLLGSKLYAEMTAKLTVRISLGLLKLINVSSNQQKFDSKISWEFYRSMSPGISLAAMMSNKPELYKLPQKFVEDPEEYDFTTNDIRIGRTNKKANVINRSTSKYWSMENANITFSSFRIFGTRPVVSSVQSTFKLGSRNLLGNSFFTHLPYKYFYIGVVNIRKSDRIWYDSVVNISSITSMNPFIVGNEKDPIYTYGTYRVSRNYYYNKDLESEKRLCLNKHNSNIDARVLGGTYGNGINTLNFNTKVRFKVNVEKTEALVLSRKVTSLGKRYLLGNNAKTYWSKIPIENIYLGNIKIGYIERVYADEATISRSYFIDNIVYIKEYKKDFTDYASLALNSNNNDSASTVLGQKKDLIVGGVSDSEAERMNFSLSAKSEVLKLSLHPVCLDNKKYKIGSRTPLGNNYYTWYSRIPPYEISLGKVFLRKSDDTQNASVDIGISNYARDLVLMKGYKYNFNDISQIKINSSNSDESSTILGKNKKLVVGGVSNVDSGVLIVNNSAKTSITRISTIPITPDSKDYSLGNRSILGTKA